MLSIQGSSRLLGRLEVCWFTTAACGTHQGRIAVILPALPWWLNLNPIMSGSAEFEVRNAVSGKKVHAVPPLSRQIFLALPEHAKSLFFHA